jgi:hypothetical protein
MSTFLYYIFLIEASIGGGGRLFPIGPMTLRMIIFALCIFVSFSFIFIRRKADGVVLGQYIAFSFIACILPSIIVGVIRQEQVIDILGQIMPMLYFLMGPFIGSVILSEKDVIITKNIIINCGFLVAASTLFLMIGLYLGIIPFNIFYSFTEGSEEFIFRGNWIFFYKGTFFVAIALIFVLNSGSKYRVVKIITMASAIAITLTRGFLIAVTFVYLLSALRRRKMFELISILFIASAAIFFWYDSILENIFYNTRRSDSILARSLDTDVFFANFNMYTLTVGNGPSSLLNEKLEIENSYLTVWWKFGTLGILFFLAPLFIAIRFLKEALNNRQNAEDAWSFFYGIVFLYIVTATNPFINNSIGIIYLLIALFCIRIIGIKVIDKQF